MEATRSDEIKRSFNKTSKLRAIVLVVIAQNQSKNIAISVIVLELSTQQSEETALRIVQTEDLFLLDHLFGLGQADATRRRPQFALGRRNRFFENLIQVAVGVAQPWVSGGALEASRESALASRVVNHARQKTILATTFLADRATTLDRPTFAAPIVQGIEPAGALFVFIDFIFTRDGILHPFNDIRNRHKVDVRLRQNRVNEIVERLPAVGVSGKPSGVHEHGERSAVSEVMTKEVVQKQVVSRLLGAVVMAC